MCLWGFRWYGSPFRWLNPQNPSFGSANRHFRAKLAKSKKHAYYPNYCIDSNQIFQNDKDHQMLLVGGPNMRTTNPRWRTAVILKIKKIAISLQGIDRFRRRERDGGRCGVNCGQRRAPNILSKSVPLNTLYRRFPDNHFPGQTFPGQVILRNFHVHSVCKYQLYRPSHTICRYTERLLMCACRPAV